MANEKRQEPGATVTCPQCQRQHQLGQAQLVTGGGFRCPCGWSLRVVRHHRREAAKARPAA